MSVFDDYIGKYVILRTIKSGVHAGVLKSFDENTKNAELTDTRRIWYWEGAFTLSTVSQQGITGGNLPAAIPLIAVMDVIEIIPCSEGATTNLREFPVHQIKS